MPNQLGVVKMCIETSKKWQGYIKSRIPLPLYYFKHLWEAFH